MLLISAALAFADELDAAGEDGERCVNARSIRGVDVIDDNHVLFHIQGRRMFLNALPKTCVGLSVEGRLSYETHTRSLCARDKIRIMREAGGGVYSGRACSLGRFQPMTKEQLDDYFKKRTVPADSQKPESADVEEVVTDKL